jgi:hypothetical protein
MVSGFISIKDKSIYSNTLLQIIAKQHHPETIYGAKNQIKKTGLLRRPTSFKVFP